MVTYSLDEDQSMNSETFCGFMDDFSSINERTRVVILDNASYHKSTYTKAYIERWKKNGVFIYFLPPRCPHLNIIETLWRKIKYSWLAAQDYRSKKALKNKIKTILKNYGTEQFDIQFSMEVFEQFF